MNIQVEEYRPADALRPYVQRFWTGRFSPLQAHSLTQRIPPHGFLDVIIHLTDHHCDLVGSAGWNQSPDYMLIGVQRVAYEVRFTRAVEVFAIRFKPAGFCSLFGVPVGELVDAHEDLVAVLDARFRDFAGRLREAPDVVERLRTAERYLLEAAADPEFTYLNRATELIRTSAGKLRVADVADRVHISRRQLERAFQRALGLSPKQYMRIARLNLVQALLRSGTHHGLADVAHRAGYADQAHFSREFKRLVGECPTRFLSEQDAYAVLDTGPGTAA